MISLAQTGLMGIAGYALANMVTQRVPGGETKGLLLGWDPTLALVAGDPAHGRDRARVRRGRFASYGIYFLMLTLTYTVIAFLFVGSVTLIGGFSPVAGVDIYTPGFIGDIATDRERLYYITLITGLRVRARALPRAHAVRHLAPGHPATSRCAWRRWVQRRAPPDDRLRHRSVHRSTRRRPLRLVVRAALADHDGARRDHSDARDRGHRGLRRIEGAWLGAIAFL